MSLDDEFEPLWRSHPTGQKLADEVVFVALRVAQGNEKNDDHEVFIASQLLMACCAKLTAWRASLGPKPKPFMVVKK